MTDYGIPSDFDPALLFSDYPNPSDDDPTQLPPSESHSDELEALHAIAEERREALNKQGVVIQHRARGLKPVFRSSSVAPDSPTPYREPQLLRGSSFWDTPPGSSPRDSSPPRAMATDVYAPLSSPPPAELDRAAKKQRISVEDWDEDMDGEETLANAENVPASKESPLTGGLPTHSAKDSPRVPCKPFVPNFNKPLTGGLFTKKFNPSSTTKPPERQPDEQTENERPTSPLSATTPPPSTPHSGSPPVPIVSSPLSDRMETHLRSINVADTYRSIKIVTSTGKTINTFQRPERSRDAGVRQDTQVESNNGAGKCYGIDMRALMSEYELDKERAKTQNGETREKEVQTTQAPEAAPARRKRTLLWTEKYRAKKFTDLIGEERTHRHVLHWMKSWDPIVFNTQQKLKKPGLNGEEREHRKILLIHGPPGLGKTTLAHVAARQAGYEAYEINASDDRTGGIVKGKIKDILTTEGIKSCGLTRGKKQTVTKKPVCLVIDEIDGVTGGGGGGGNEAGFVKALTDLILEDQWTDRQPTQPAGTVRRKGRKKEMFKLQRPIIAICNDLYAPALRALRPLAEIVQMRKPPVGLMIDRLRWVFDKEGFAAEDGAVRKLVELSSMGSAGGNKGDMRGALVCGEWIAARLKREAPAAAKKGKGRRLLTRKLVEDEFSGGTIGEADGKTAGAGKASVRDAVECIFQIEKERPALRGGKTIGGKKASAEKVQSLVEGLGEFDKITMDCFATYPSRHFHDDSVLSKPNAAYDWLYFSDLISLRVYTEQDYELTPYLTHPILAFHHLFASSTARPQDPSSNALDSAEEAPFSGPNADWQAYEAKKQNTALINAIHASLATPRLSQTFKSPATIAIELVPYLNRMLSPRINPVSIGGSSGGTVASVRKDSEKKLVARAVNAMDATGVTFEKVRIEAIPGATSTASGWAYRMEPAVDALGLFPTLTGAESQGPVRYAVRQVLDQEYRKAVLLKEKAAREARMGKLLAAPAGESQSQSSSATSQSQSQSQSTEDGKRKGKVKRDFFGRLIVEAEKSADTEKEAEDGRERKRRRVVQAERDQVWVTFHEGFSNAVRKGICLEELMAGFI